MHKNIMAQNEIQPFILDIDDIKTICKMGGLKEINAIRMLEDYEVSSFIIASIAITMMMESTKE